MCHLFHQTLRSCDPRSPLISQNNFVFFTPLLYKITLHYFSEFYGFLAVQTHTVVVGYDTVFTGTGIIYFRGKCCPPKCWQLPTRRHIPADLLTYLLTYSMEQGPSWEANWFAAGQEIPRILCNPKVPHRTHKRPPPVPILSPPNPVLIP